MHGNMQTSNRLHLIGVDLNDVLKYAKVLPFAFTRAVERLQVVK